MLAWYYWQLCPVTKLFRLIMVQFQVKLVTESLFSHWQSHVETKDDFRCIFQIHGQLYH